MKKLSSLLALSTALLLSQCVSAPVAFASSTSGVVHNVGVCDPDNQTNCLKPSSGGAFPSTTTIVDGGDVAQGSKGDAAATDSTSSWTVVALLKGLLAQQLSANPVQTYSADNYTRINTNTTTVVKNAPGSVAAIVVNAVGTTETVTIYDSLTGSGTNPFTFVLTGLPVGTRISLNAKFGTGITVVTSGGGACDITVMTQ